MRNFNKKIGNYIITSSDGIICKSNGKCISKTPIVVTGILFDKRNNVFFEITWLSKISGKAENIIVGKGRLVDRSRLRQLCSRILLIDDCDIPKLSKYFADVFVEYNGANIKNISERTII